MLTNRLLPPALLASFTLVCLPALAQRIPPPKAHMNPNPVVTRPESIQDSGLYGYWSQMTEQDRTGGALLGKVVVANGLLPWDPIVVDVNCGGAVAYTAETDSKGYFTVLPSRISGELSQLGDRERQMKVHFEGCALQAFLAGFDSSSLTITEHNLRDSPEVGTITLTRRTAARGTAMSQTSKSAPEEAAEHWRKAGEELLAEKSDRARKQLEEAVKIYPGFADAWYRLGVLQLQTNPGAAEACLRKATAADPAFVSPHEQLAGLAIQEGNWLGALTSVANYLRLDPSGTQHIWYYSAMANLQLGNSDAAEKSAKTLLAMDPLHNIRNGEQMLAVILARKAQYADALTHLRHCLSYIPDGPDAELVRQQIAQLEKHVGKPE